jgi:anti-anti-sigma factor
LNVTVDQRAGGVAVVRLSGRLDLASAGAVKSRITSTVSSGYSKLVVDLTHVPFIDSSGLGALIGGLRAARTAAGDMRIAAPCEQVRFVLRLTTLDRVLTPHTDVEAALVGY